MLLRGIDRAPRDVPKGRSPEGHPEVRGVHCSPFISNQDKECAVIQYQQMLCFTQATSKKFRIPYSSLVKRIVWHIGRVLGFGIFAQGSITGVSGRIFLHNTFCSFLYLTQRGLLQCCALCCVLGRISSPRSDSIIEYFTHCSAL